MASDSSDLPKTTSDILGLRAELRQTRLDLQDRIIDLDIRVAYLRLYGIGAASMLFLGLMIIGRAG